MSSVESAIASVPGVVGVSAKHLDSGEQILHNANDIFFTASTFKVPLLLELYRQVDEGKINLNERIDLNRNHRVPGSGVLKELGEGLRLTLHDLATLMIIISDNTATDILYDTVGGENIANTMQNLGLNQTKVPMTTRQLLYSVVGMDPAQPTHTYQMASDKLFLNQLVMDSDGYSEELSDVSSPADMSKLLEIVYQGNVLSTESRRGFLDILGKQQLRNVIPHKLPVGVEVGHKTGSYYGVRCDVGIVNSPNGAYTVAIMAKNVEGDRLVADLRLADVSSAIYDQFSE